MVQEQIKVCPVVTRVRDGQWELLLFQHPLAGVQLVKGTLELEDASIESAACRELAEESGIQTVDSTSDLGIWHSGYQGQIWHLVHCHCSQRLPDQWVFHTVDDGGHDFAFFWYVLRPSVGNGHGTLAPLPFACHPVFQRAIQTISTRLGGCLHE